VALSAEMITNWLSRSLDDLDLCVIMIDGIDFGERSIVVALGTEP